MKKRPAMAIMVKGLTGTNSPWWARRDLNPHGIATTRF